MPVGLAILWAILCIGGLVLGVLIRFGPPRRDFLVYTRYYERDMPRYVRNGALVLIPLSSVNLLLLTSILSFSLGRLWSIVGLVLALLWLVGSCVTVVLAHYPPDWLKPEWLREEERRRQAHD